MKKAGVQDHDDVHAGNLWTDSEYLRLRNRPIKDRLTQSDGEVLQAAFQGDERQRLQALEILALERMGEAICRAANEKDDSPVGAIFRLRLPAWAEARKALDVANASGNVECIAKAVIALDGAVDACCSALDAAFTEIGKSSRRGSRLGVEKRQRDIEQLGPMVIAEARRVIAEEPGHTRTYYRAHLMKQFHLSDDSVETLAGKLLPKITRPGRPKKK